MNRGRNKTMGLVLSSIGIGALLTAVIPIGVVLMVGSVVLVAVGWWIFKEC